VDGENGRIWDRDARNLYVPVEVKKNHEEEYKSRHTYFVAQRTCSGKPAGVYATIWGMSVQSDLQKLKNKEKAKLLQGYFKTGKGEYAQGDVFIGLTVPQMRVIAKKYRDLPLGEIEKLLHNKIHEYRLTALIILTHKKLTKDIVDLYLRNTKYVNNWDLVDLSSHEILGTFLLDKPRTILYKLARSKNIWERRIAVISTFVFLKHNDVSDSLKLATLLRNDPHDLMHKAVGWMLREVGKRDEKALVGFLATQYKTMPRTMLRYAIEKFPAGTRKKYLAGIF
jgi:3-methyladenine DNA glycosylase AlkD